MSVINIKIKREGLSFEEYQKKIKQQFVNTHDTLRIMGRDTAYMMRVFITILKKSKIGDRLENAIRVHEEPKPNNSILIGIGLISHLDQFVPYWRIVNWGGKYTLPAIYPKKEGGWLRFIGKQDGEIVYAKKVRSRPQVISPMYYIEKTAVWVKNNMNRIHRAWGGKTSMYRK